MATKPPRENEEQDTPDSLPPSPDPVTPDEGVENIEKEGEPFPGNFA